MKLKITTVGNSAGVILPKELLARLRLEKGDALYATQLPDGSKLRPYENCVVRSGTRSIPSACATRHARNGNSSFASRQRADAADLDAVIEDRDGDIAAWGGRVIPVRREAERQTKVDQHPGRPFTRLLSCALQRGPAHPRKAASARTSLQFPRRFEAPSGT